MKDNIKNLLFYGLGYYTHSVPLVRNSFDTFCL